MQFQILNSLAIYTQPMIDVGVFLPGVTILNFLKSGLIELNKNGTERQSKY